MLLFRILFKFVVMTTNLPILAKLRICFGQVDALVRGLVDAFQMLLHGVVLGKIHAHQRQVPLDRHQDVVETVRQAAGQRTQGFHLLGLVQLRLIPLLVLAGFDLFGNIPDNAPESNGALIFSQDGRCREFNGQGVPLFVKNFIVGGADVLAFLVNPAENGLPWPGRSSATSRSV